MAAEPWFVDSEEGHLEEGKCRRWPKNSSRFGGLEEGKCRRWPKNSSGARWSTIVWLLVLVPSSCGIPDEGNIRPLAGLGWSKKHGNELAVACVSSMSRITATPRGTAFMRLHGGPGKTGEQRLQLCTREDMWAVGILTHVTARCNKFPYHRRGNRRMGISAGHDADLYPWPSLDALTYDRDSVLDAVDWNERIELRCICTRLSQPARSMSLSSTKTAPFSSSTLEDFLNTRVGLDLLDLLVHFVLHLKGQVKTGQTCVQRVD